jgi:hypothetical protein
MVIIFWDTGASSQWYRALEIHAEIKNLSEEKNRATQKSKSSGFHIDTYGL